MNRTITRLTLYLKRRGWHPPRFLAGIAHGILRRSTAELPGLEGWERQLIGDGPLGPLPVSVESSPDGACGDRRPSGAAPARLRCLIAVGELDVSGLSQFAATLARRLPEFGVEASVAHTKGDVWPFSEVPARLADALRAQGVAVTEVTDSAGAAAVLDAGRFDVISTHGAPEWWIEHASQRGVPVVNVLQGLFYKDWCSDSRWASQLAHLVAVSDHVRRGFLAQCPGFDGDRVTTILNAPDERRLPRIDRAAAREWLGIGDEFVFVSFGRHCTQKNAYGLVRGFGQLAATVPDAHLLIAGRLDDRVYTQLTRELQDSLPAAGRIHLHDHLEWPSAVLAAADAFVLDSFFEGGPIASMEALRAGVPVVLSRTGCAPEQVGEDGWGGYLVENPAGDEFITPDAVEPYIYGEQPNTAELVGAMAKLVDDRELWLTRREELAVEAATRFSADVCVRAHAEVLLAVAGR
jgi:glycosyltransferase involved in cell wall biosynthesis